MVSASQVLGLTAGSTTAWLEKDFLSGFQSKISHSQINLYQGSEWLNQSVTAMNSTCLVFLAVDVNWLWVHWRVWGNQTQCGDERLWRNAESTDTSTHWVNHHEFDWSFEKPTNQLERHPRLFLQKWIKLSLIILFELFALLIHDKNFMGGIINILESYPVWSFSNTGTKGYTMSLT